MRASQMSTLRQLDGYRISLLILTLRITFSETSSKHLLLIWSKLDQTERGLDTELCIFLPNAGGRTRSRMAPIVYVPFCRLADQFVTTRSTHQAAAEKEVVSSPSRIQSTMYDILDALKKASRQERLMRAVERLSGHLDLDQSHVEPIVEQLR